MNVLEHIEAGHYERDPAGRALVPMRCGSRATVCCADAPGHWRLIGWCGDDELSAVRWDADGNIGYYGPSGRDLLPPPPRKVKVTRWAIINSHGVVVTTYGHQFAPAAGQRLVELTGEYEEPWT